MHILLDLNSLKTIEKCSKDNVLKKILLTKVLLFFVSLLKINLFSTYFNI